MPSFKDSWEEYAEMYCWGNAYSMPLTTSMFETEPERKTNAISYHQWVREME
jgi:hypothetical protein